MTLMEKCYFVRKCMKISQKDFAKIIGSTQCEISFVERGFIPTDGRKIVKIEKLYVKFVGDTHE